MDWLCHIILIYLTLLELSDRSNPTSMDVSLSLSAWTIFIQLNPRYVNYIMYYTSKSNVHEKYIASILHR